MSGFQNGSAKCKNAAKPIPFQCFLTLLVLKRILVSRGGWLHFKIPQKVTFLLHTEDTIWFILNVIVRKYIETKTSS